MRILVLLSEFCTHILTSRTHSAFSESSLLSSICHHALVLFHQSVIWDIVQLWRLWTAPLRRRLSWQRMAVCMQCDSFSRWEPHIWEGIKEGYLLLICTKMSYRFSEVNGTCVHDACLVCWIQSFFSPCSNNENHDKDDYSNDHETDTYFPKPLGVSLFWASIYMHYCM